MRWPTALIAVTVVLVCPRPSPAPPFNTDFTFDCRDGGSSTLVTVTNHAIPGFSAKSVIHYRVPTCDVDERCDGICTFSGSAGGACVGYKIAVGESFEAAPFGPESIRYRCRAGAPSKCKALRAAGTFPQ